MGVMSGAINPEVLSVMGAPEGKGPDVIEMKMLGGAAAGVSALAAVPEPNLSADGRGDVTG